MNHTPDPATGPGPTGPPPDVAAGAAGTPDRRGPDDPLEPWPETVAWQPVSRDLTWVELLRLAATVGGVLAVLGVAWALTGLPSLGLLAGAVLLLALWRASVIVRAV
ncbi:MAG TPA: hypothetical protein VGD43_24185, partial [Micromonospora sp.]